MEGLEAPVICHGSVGARPPPTERSVEGDPDQANPGQPDCQQKPTKSRAVHAMPCIDDSPLDPGQIPQVQLPARSKVTSRLSRLHLFLFVDLCRNLLSYL
jgi:hypothetical protein